MVGEGVNWLFDLSCTDIASLLSLLACGDDEVNSLTLLQGAETRSTEVGEVHEDISAISARDEAETLLLREPLDGTLLAGWLSWCGIREGANSLDRKSVV